MKVDISNSQRIKNSSIKKENNIMNKKREKLNITISENYQGFISIIYFIIGCCFLFYLFSFVFSIYVSYKYK